SFHGQVGRSRSELHLSERAARKTLLDRGLNPDRETALQNGREPGLVSPHEESRWAREKPQRSLLCLRRAPLRADHWQSDKLGERALRRAALRQRADDPPIGR